MIDGTRLFLGGCIMSDRCQLNENIFEVWSKASKRYTILQWVKREYFFLQIGEW